MINLKKEINWILTHSPRTKKIINNLPSLDGIKIACNMHLDIKMIPFVESLLKKGAQVHLTTCNTATVQDRVIEYLENFGAKTCAWHNMDSTAWSESLYSALEWQPNYLCEMGASLTSLIHNKDNKIKVNIKAGLEGTGSGINNLNKLKPHYPIFNWDDLPVKEDLHNRHMVGLTACHTFFNTTKLTMHEKTVLVIGYGLVGQGVADAAKAYGGEVIVAELDSAQIIKAKYNGIRVVALEKAISEADIIITATGAKNVLCAEYLKNMKNGVFLLNVGHVTEEIDIEFLQNNYNHSLVMPFVDCYSTKNNDNKQIFVLANGAMVNLAAGYGDSINAFDITLATMAAGIEYIITEGSTRESNLYLLPEEVWRKAIS